MRPRACRQTSATRGDLVPAQPPQTTLVPVRIVWLLTAAVVLAHVLVLRGLAMNLQTPDDLSTRVFSTRSIRITPPAAAPVALPRRPVSLTPPSRPETQTKRAVQPRTDGVLSSAAPVPVPPPAPVESPPLIAPLPEAIVEEAVGQVAPPEAAASAPESVSAANTGDPVATGRTDGAEPLMPAASAEAATTAAAAEAPVVSTEAPVVSTEAPVVSPEAPAVSTEAPVVSTEAPVVSTQAPAVSTQAPTVAIGAPAASAEYPVTVAVDATRPLTIPGSIRLAFDAVGKRGQLDYRALGDLTWLQDGDNYEMRLEMGDWFIGKRVLSSTGKLTAGGLAPARFSDKFRSERAAHFDRGAGRIVFSANTPHAELMSGAQDQLSIFAQLAALVAGDPLAFAIGTTITIQTAGPRDAEPWEFSVEREEMLYLPGGHVPALKLVRKPNSDYGQTVELWLAPELAFLPARIRITFRNGDFLDQQWKSSSPP